jgi:hypothetical protein
MTEASQLLFGALTATIGTSVFFMFLPVIVELKKPKDAGPRLIAEYFVQTGLGTLKNSLMNLEEEEPLCNQLTATNVVYPLSISNLEADFI